MTIYTDVFTGSTVYPTEVTLTKLDLTTDVVLFWPQEAQPNQPVASSIVEIDTSDAANWEIAMPSALSASNGQTVLFNNRSGQVVIVTTTNGTQIVSLASGEQWQVYLADNTTADGTWRTYQFGAGVSTTNASALAGNGIRAIGSQLYQSTQVINFTTSVTLGNNDRAKFYNWEGSGAGLVVTLPDPSVVGNDWFVQLRNSGNSSFNVTPPGSAQIDGLSTLVFNEGDSAFIVSDGTNFFTIGLGQDPVFAFDYAVVDVTGATNYVLSGSELNRVAYEFTGVLGADISVVVPPVVQQYWVYDNTTPGAYTLSIKTAAQVSPLVLVRGDRVITYCTGTDVVPTQAAGVVGVITGGSF